MFKSFPSRQPRSIASPTPRLWAGPGQSPQSLTARGAPLPTSVGAGTLHRSLTNTPRPLGPCTRSRKTPPPAARLRPSPHPEAGLPPIPGTRRSVAGLEWVPWAEEEAEAEAEAEAEELSKVRGEGRCGTARGGDSLRLRLLMVYERGGRSRASPRLGEKFSRALSARAEPRWARPHLAGCMGCAAVGGTQVLSATGKWVWLTRAA